LKKISLFVFLIYFSEIQLGFGSTRNWSIPKPAIPRIWWRFHQTTKVDSYYANGASTVWLFHGEHNFCSKERYDYFSSKPTVPYLTKTLSLRIEWFITIWLLVTKLRGLLPALMEVGAKGKLDLGQAIQQLWNLVRNRKDQKGANPPRILGASGRFGTLHLYSRKNGSGKLAKSKENCSINHLIIDFNGQKYTTAYINNRLLSGKWKPNH